MCRRLQVIGICLLLGAAQTPLQANETEEGIAFFETKIRPVLIQHCYDCHSEDARSLKGGLRLDTRQATLAGGDSGPAVIPHEPEQSLLLAAIRYEDYEMPPKGPLPESVVADFRAWIELGAPDPRSGKAVIRRQIDLQEGRQFWAFQPLRRPHVPETGADWPVTDIDQFLFAAMRSHDLMPVADADGEVWLRRVHFDLTGLPPTAEELHEFSIDDTPAAREAVVDRLLDSPHFGERWGRHWLDLARYAESTGRTRNYPFPFAWRYRDYVIRAFHDDKPLDQFIIEQLAGDLLPAQDEAQRHEWLTATGFLALGSPDLNERDAKVFQMDAVADQIDTVSRSLLGLTVGCARCHDHKFDPIPTEDYYALAGIFTSTQRLNGYASRVGGGNRMRGDLLIPLGDTPPKVLSPEEELVEGLDAKKAQRLVESKRAADEAKAKLNQIRRDKQLTQVQRNRRLAAARKAANQKTQQFNQLRNRFDRSRDVQFEGPACMGVRDADQIADCKVHIRGDAHKLGDPVPRGFLQVLSGESAALPAHQSGRSELAQWIASPENPLTPRVFVNRVWRHLFGRGLVRTVDNFGAMGAKPSHPDLLDYLAGRFIEQGWSVKQLIRSLVLTRAYGLAAMHDDRNANMDADNAYLWRMNARRLDYEALRDAVLAISGELLSSPPSGSPVSGLKIGELSRQKLDPIRAKIPHRSVYLPVLRNLLPPEATAFDFPNASETRGARDVTTVPTQSLYLMNSPFIVRLADLTAERLLASNSVGSDTELVQSAYQRLFSRWPTAVEVDRVREYVAEREAELSPQAGDARRAAWSEVIHAMFASAEFRYR